MKAITAVACGLALTAAACAASKITLHCRVTVPKEYRKVPLNPPPNGKPEPVRYTVAYRAYWWNCVAVRAADLKGRCPFVAGGTPAAAAGASDGALDADRQIDRLLKKDAAGKVQRYLRSIASTPTAKEEMRPYFKQPTAEVAK